MTTSSCPGRRHAHARDALLRAALALALLAGLLPLRTALALDPERSPSQYLYERYGREQGMPSDTVWVSRQDPRGYLWLGTKNGLVRFDGVRFTLYNKEAEPAFRSNDVRDIAIMETGDLWLATYGGGVLHYSDGRFRRLDRDSGLADNVVHDVYLARNGDIWFATNGGVSRLRKGELRNWNAGDGLTDNRVFRIAESANGAMWFITLTNGISYFDGETFRNYTEGSGLDSTQVHVAHDDPELGLFISTINGTLYRLGSDGSVTHLDSELSGKLPVHSALRDSDGNLWLGTYARGLWRHSPAGELVEVPLAGAEPGYVFDLMEDRNGNVWACTINGVYRLRDSAFLPYGKSEGLADGMFVVTQSPVDGAIWAGSEGSGLFRLGADGEITQYDESSGLSNPNISALWVDTDNTVWAGTFGGGLNRLSPDGSVRHFDTADGLPNNHIFGLYRDSRDRLWVSADGGVGWLDASGRYQGLESLPDTLYRQINEDDQGRIWIASNRGLVRVDDTGARVLGEADGLGSELVSTTYEDDSGTLWIGSREAGLARLRNGELFQFKKQHGLPQLSVLAILEDGRGNLWLSGADGLVSVPLSQLNRVAEGEAAHFSAHLFDESDGLRSAQFLGGYQPSGWLADDGQMWFANNRGLVSIDPDELSVDRAPPLPLIEAVRVDGRPVPINDPLQLPATASSLEVDYTVPELSNPQDLRFRYRLDSRGSGWQVAGQRRTAFFTGLPAGAITLRIEAALEADEFSGDAATQTTLALYREPRFYQTWWFILLAAAAFVGLTGGLYRLAIYRATLRQRQLETLVDRRTRELQVALSRVEEISRMDSLTGIANRRYFDENLADAWRQCAEQRAPVSIIMLDIDHFKQYNDSLGHQAGDDCLLEVARALRGGVLREGDLIARYGGEEFIALLPGADRDSAIAIARRIQARVRELNIPHPASPSGDAVTISLGCATARPADGGSADDLLQRADRALYRAKNKGRNRLELCPEG